MAATGIDRSSVASLVAKLTEIEFLARRKRPSHNRIYDVYLTADGEAAFRRNLAVADQIDADLLSPLSRTERTGFVKFLRTLANSTRR